MESSCWDLWSVLFNSKDGPSTLNIAVHTHFPSTVKILFQKSSLLSRKSKETQMPILNSRCLAVSWCGTRWSNLLMKPSLCIRLSTVVLCAENVSANSTTVGCSEFICYVCVQTLPRNSWSASKTGINFTAPISVSDFSKQKAEGGIVHGFLPIHLVNTAASCGWGNALIILLH